MINKWTKQKKIPSKKGTLLAQGEESTYLQETQNENQYKPLKEMQKLARKTNKTYSQAKDLFALFLGGELGSNVYVRFFVYFGSTSFNGSIALQNTIGSASNANICFPIVSQNADNVPCGK